MTHATLANWSNLVGALAVMSLGVWMLTVKPRTTAAKGFAILAIGFGGYFAMNHLSSIVHLPGVLVNVWAPVFTSLWISGLIIMAFTFPRALTRQDRGALGIAAAAAATIIVVRVSAQLAFAPNMPIDRFARDFLMTASTAAFFGYLVLLVLRYRSSEDLGFKQQAVLTAGSITLFLGFVSTYGIAMQPGRSILFATGADRALVFTTFVIMSLVAGTWLTLTRGPTRRMAVVMLFLSLSTMLTGLVMAALRIEGGHGIARILLAASLAYAVVQHGLLGIDVKLRFAISKSTIAAVFIAVFFIASETAQQFFGDTLGSTYVGIAAAGALVFAMAPLQRVAERLAEKAVPPITPPSPMADATRAAATYQAAVRAALRDGRVTRNEEVHLAEVAELLGLGPRDATRLRHEIEDAHTSEAR